MRNNFYSNLRFSKNKATSNNRTRGLILINHIHNKQEKDNKPTTGLQSLGKLHIARNPIPFYCRTYTNRTEPTYLVCTAKRSWHKTRGQSCWIQTIAACSRQSGNTYWGDCKIRRLKGDGYFAGESRWSELSPRRYSDRYIVQSKDILKSILNDDVSTDSDREVDDV